MSASSSLTTEQRAFLTQHGLGQAEITPLPGDASARRYFRVEGQGLLLMTDPTDPVGFAGYLDIAAHLRGLGLSAPFVKAAAQDLGLALIEDWGNGTYTRRLAEGRDETTLYATAVDALRALHDHPHGVQIARPTMDMALLQEEIATTFSAWFAPALAPDLDHAAFCTRFAAAWADALVPVTGRPSALVLRDFHIDNLMELDARSGPARAGLLDFQDAALGAPEYDLVSLLQDARRDVAPALEEAMLARYFTGSPAQAQLEARRRYHILGAQRHCRIIGVFVRLAQRDAKLGYLTWLPRVIGQFDHALTAAGLSDVRAVLDDTLPDWAIRGRALASTLVR